MREKWYGDNRDVVKWSALLIIAERFSLKHVLQVLYYRPTDWPTIEVDGEQVAVPPAVIRHFRNLQAVSAITCAPRIEVFPDPFVHRDTYQQALLDRIRRRPTTPGIVFLDPDTGLAPRRPSLDHVLSREVSEIWAALTVGDVLVLYQHQTRRDGQRWIGPKKEQFEQAIGLPIGSAKVAKSERMARDVAFFYVQKAG